MLGDLPRAGVAACGVVLSYVELTQKDSRPKLDLPRRQANAGIMAVDAATRRNLELVTTLSGQKQKAACLASSTVRSPVPADGCFAPC